jgi:ribosomal protein S1
MGDAAAGWTWDEVKERLPVGTEVTGRVVAVRPFGVFVDLGVGFSGLLEVPNMAGEGRKTEADYPQVGQVVTANVLWHRDTNQQICLTQQGWIVKDQS